VQVEQLPDLLKSHKSGVGMSLILRAARDVPLHLLSEEYEKVRCSVNYVLRNSCTWCVRCKSVVGSIDGLFYLLSQITASSCVCTHGGTIVPGCRTV
jgi:hypothetical protein